MLRPESFSFFCRETSDCHDCNDARWEENVGNCYSLRLVTPTSPEHGTGTCNRSWLSQRTPGVMRFLVSIEAFHPLLLVFPGEAQKVQETSHYRTALKVAEQA